MEPIGQEGRRFRKRSWRRGLAHFFRQGNQQSSETLDAEKKVPDPLELLTPSNCRIGSTFVSSCAVQAWLSL